MCDLLCIVIIVIINRHHPNYCFPSPSPVPPLSPSLFRCLIIPSSTPVVGVSPSNRITRSRGICVAVESSLVLCSGFDSSCSGSPRNGGRDEAYCDRSPSLLSSSVKLSSIEIRRLMMLSILSRGGPEFRPMPFR